MDNIGGSSTITTVPSSYVTTWTPAPYVTSNRPHLYLSGRIPGPNQSIMPIRWTSPKPSNCRQEPRSVPSHVTHRTDTNPPSYHAAYDLAIRYAKPYGTRPDKPRSSPRYTRRHTTSATSYHAGGSSTRLHYGPPLTLSGAHIRYALQRNGSGVTPWRVSDLHTNFHLTVYYIHQLVRLLFTELYYTDTNLGTL